MVIKIEEKEYTLKYNNRAVFEIERLIDKPIIKIISDENELGKVGTMYAILYCGLKDQLTYDYVIDNTPLEYLNTIIEEVFGMVLATFETGVKKKVTEEV